MSAFKEGLSATDAKKRMCVDRLTEKHPGVEVAFGRGAVAKVDDGAVLAPPRGVALERVAHARRLRYLRRQRGRDRMIMQLLGAVVLRESAYGSACHCLELTARTKSGTLMRLTTGICLPLPHGSRCVPKHWFMMLSSPKPRKSNTPDSRYCAAPCHSSVRQPAPSAHALEKLEKRNAKLSAYREPYARRSVPLGSAGKKERIQVGSAYSLVVWRERGSRANNGRLLAVLLARPRPRPRP